MKLKYKKKSIHGYLIIGLTALIIGIVTRILFEKNEWTSSLFGIGIAFIGTYFYNLKFQYIAIKNGFIKESGLLGSKLKIDKITSFKKFARDYILTAGNNELHNNIELMDSDSLVELQEFISGLELNSSKIETKK